MRYSYSLLPTHSGGPDKPSTTANITRLFLSRRYARFSALALFTFACLTLVVPHETPNWLPNTELWPLQSSEYPPYPVPRDSPPPTTTNDTNILPPLYQRYTAYEQSLPQHNDSLPFPEGSNAKFIYFANHAWGAGWGNIMQEMVLDAHLAYASGRAFVFDNYTWNRDDGQEYSDFNGKPIPSRIPLSALVAGPLVGQPYANSTTALEHPRAISRHYYNRVCPEPYVLNSEVVRKTIPADASALETMNIWIEKLRSIKDRCVEIEKDTPQLFDIWLIGSPRLHDILPTLMDSPVMRDFAWSPLIHYAFQRNQHHFSSSRPISPPRRKRPLSSILFPYLFPHNANSPRDDDDLDFGFTLPPTPSTIQTQPLPLLALHLRRGDFIQHCDHLAEWGSMYTGYNTLPLLPDRFFAENSTLRNEMSETEVKEGYREKCLVDVDKVRKRVVRAVKEWRVERLREEREKRGTTGWWSTFFGLGSGWRERSEEERVKKMLRKVYIMTNGDREFLDELKSALYHDASRSSVTVHSTSKPESGPEFDYDFVWTWDEISTSRDLEWGWETKYVAQAMDMYVGQRAEVFVGNGFSSLTANVVLMRFVAGIEPWRTRFW